MPSIRLLSRTKHASTKHPRHCKHCIQCVLESGVKPVKQACNIFFNFSNVIKKSSRSHSLESVVLCLLHVSSQCLLAGTSTQAARCAQILMAKKAVQTSDSWLPVNVHVSRVDALTHKQINSRSRHTNT